MALDHLAVWKPNRLRSAMLKADPVPDLGRGLLHGPLKIDAPNGMTLALVVFQRHEIAAALAGLMLVRRTTMLDQAARSQRLAGLPGAELVLCGVKLRPVAMPVHGDIG